MSCWLRLRARASSSDLHLLQRHAGAVVHHVRDRRRPHEPVARLVSAASGIGDRRHDAVHQVVLDDEEQQRLRQEARLEDAPAVLVRDPALPAVADRLDDRHAHMPGRFLDGIDHRLDALADDDRLDLDHTITSLRRSIRTLSRQRPSRLAIRLRTPTTRKPTRSCSFRAASFSGKIDVWSYENPARSLFALSASISERPLPLPRASLAM